MTRKVLIIGSGGAIKNIFKLKAKMETQIVVFSNMENNTYFFSKNHCQKHNLGNDFVPTTHTLPSFCEPRESVPDGVIKDVKDLVSVFYYDMEEIPNPDKDMQVVFKISRDANKLI